MSLCTYLSHLNLVLTTNKFAAASHSEIIYHTTHAFVKLFRDSPVQASSLPNYFHLIKIGHHVLIVMATIISKHEIFFFKTHSYADNAIQAFKHIYYIYDI